MSQSYELLLVLAIEGSVLCNIGARTQSVVAGYCG